MELNYKLTFGKFKGSTLKEIADENPWYLNMIVKVTWLLNKIRKEMNESDIDYLQKAQTKYNKEKEIRINNRIVGSYFPSEGWNRDDHSNDCGIHGEF